MKKVYFYLSLAIIISISFLYNSSLYSPILNSDDAVVPLMIYDFHFPHDLYYWGANRFGSLIPLIGQVFYRIFLLTPLTSEAITHYLLLILGFWGFSSLFKSKLSKIIFGIIWFLPPLRMIDILKLSQGEQYCLIGMAIYYINKLNENIINKYSLKNHIYLMLVTLLMILSVWVSDLAVITIFILLLVHLIYFVKIHKNKTINVISKFPEFYYIFSGIILCTLFIYFAKSHALSENNYYDFFEVKIFINSFKIFIKSIIDLLLFNANEPYTSLYTYCIILILIYLAVIYWKVKFSNFSLKWSIIFAIDLLSVFVVILSSKWSYLNGVPRRYFVCSYISFWIVLLLTLENINELKIKKSIHFVVLIVTLLGGLGTILSYKYVWSKTTKPMVEIVKEFEKLGKIGVIADYWNSYIISVNDPENIKATPHDKSNVRNQNLVDEVFKQPNLYVIKDIWMKSFPDTLEQFGYVLLKEGDQFKMGGCDVCKYQKIKMNKYFPLAKMKYNKAKVIYDNVIKSNVLYASSGCDSCKENFIVYGPYIPIGIGNYTIQFYLKAEKPVNENPIAFIDVAADCGQTQLATKKLFINDFLSSSKYQKIELNFSATKRYNNAEFRLYYYGNANIYFEHIVLSEK
jgi:hypothetical protein